MWVATPGLVLCLMLCSQLLCAQDSGNNATFRSDTRLVVLHASVADNKGRLLTNLKQSAFKVYENDIEQPIKRFLREDIPVSLALVVDNSGSMRDKRKKVEAAALALVKASNPRDEVTIVNFNDEAFQDVPFTNDIKKMEEGLSRLDSRGGTAMRDAISMSIDYMMEKGKHDKKVILVITDGNDTASTLTLEKLVAKARQSEVLLYMVGLLTEEDRREAKKAVRALDTLAQASGGSSTYPKEMADVEKVALDIAAEIRNQYLITYTPTAQALDGSFRRIKVAVNAPGRPVARTRSGYFASPDQPLKKSADLSQSAPKHQ
jgi:Ca-activated chloride channel family protein